MLRMNCLCTEGRLCGPAIVTSRNTLLHSSLCGCTAESLPPSAPRAPPILPTHSLCGCTVESLPPSAPRAPHGSILPACSRSSLVLPTWFSLRLYCGEPTSANALITKPLLTLLTLLTLLLTLLTLLLTLLMLLLTLLTLLALLLTLLALLLTLLALLLTLLALLLTLLALLLTLLALL